jgi:hypothetical protein
MVIPAVTLTFSNNGGSTTTDRNGNYTHPVTPGWSGIVTPSKTGYKFTPDSLSYQNVESNKSDEDYTAEAISPVISGSMTTPQGTVVPGVKLVFSNNGGTTYTDANGNYSQAVAYGWFGTVTPSKARYAFDPPSRKYPDAVNNDLPGQDYKATPSSLSISGRVTTTRGEGVQGVILIFSDGGGSATTDATGNYTHRVNYGWSGTVTPEKDEYTFEPPSRSYENVTSDRLNQDYKSIRPIISGIVSISEAGAIKGLDGVKITFSNGVASTHTRLDGHYSQEVHSKWSGTVTPEKPGYHFTPTSQDYSNVISNMPGQNYSAAPGSAKLNLKAERLEEKKLLIRKQYVKLDLTLYEKEGNPTISSYIISRKEPGSDYTKIKEIPGDELDKGVTKTYYDWSIEENESYTYKAKAIDSKGAVIGESDETEEI